MRCREWESDNVRNTRMTRVLSVDCGVPLSRVHACMHIHMYVHMCNGKDANGAWEGIVCFVF